MATPRSTLRSWSTWRIASKSPAGADEGRSVGTRIGRVASSATTGDDGVFVLPDLAPGVYRLRADHGEHAPSDVLALELAPGADRNDVELRVSAGGTITGEIFLDGRPDGDRKVGAYSRGAGDSTTTVTDALGRFTCEHLRAGAYAVISQPGPEDTGDFTRSTEVEVVEGEIVHVVLGAAPENPIRVFGRVTRAGEPVGEGTVLITHDGTRSFEDQRGDVAGDGTYEVVVAAPGEVLVIYQKLIYRTPPFDYPANIAGDDEVRIDIELPTGSIAGIVLDASGAPVARQPVTLRRQSGPAQRTFFGQARGAISQADGTFVITDVEAGTFSLCTGGKRYRGRVKGAAVVVQGIEVGDTEHVEGVELRVPAAGTVKGRVTDLSGAGVAGAAVFAFDTEGRALQTLTPIETDPTGAFVYEGLPEGDVHLHARAKSGASDVLGPIRVSREENADVVLPLAPATKLRVRIVDEWGAAVRARVHVFDGSSRDFADLASIAAMIAGRQETFPASDQRLGPLPPGRYRIEASAFGGGTAETEVDLAGEEELEVAIRLAG